MADQWLSIVEYARETGISDMTIRRRIRTGRIAAELRDGKYFIPVTVNETNGQLLAVKGNVRNNSNTTSPHSVVKNHPSADRTIHRAMPVVERAEISRNNASPHVANKAVGPAVNVAPTDNGFLPEALAKPLVEAGMASVEARGLIEFCHRALEQARSTVASVEARFASRLDALHSQLAQKDQEIRSLNQQIEDLQLLVQILERKKTS